MTEIRLPDDGTDATTADASRALAAVVVRHADEPDECTIFPTDADGEEIVTTWISAREGSFVGLDEMR